MDKYVSQFRVVYNSAEGDPKHSGWDFLEDPTMGMLSVCWKVHF